FRALYSGEALSPLKLQYRDYSEWQQGEQQQERIVSQEAFWLRTFQGELPVLNLPLDFVRPVMQSYEGATVSFVLSEEETGQIKSFGQAHDQTLYMSLLSVFSLLLSRMSGQESIVVGTPVAGRNHSDLENIVGLFVNTLALRNEVKGEDTVKEFVTGLRENTLAAYENQDYQFEDLVDKLSIERDTSRNPIFDVMFNLLNQSDQYRDLSAFDRSDQEHTPGVSKFDLTLTAVDCGKQLLLSFNYCTQLFQAGTIDRYILYFRQLVGQLTGNQEGKLSELELMSQAEREQLLYEFNATESDYPQDKTIPQLFEEQVRRTPDRIALSFGQEQLSYRELNERSDRLAACLLIEGALGESFVGLLLDRSMALYIGVLGILKAGKAYLPIDPSLPATRMEYMIKDSGVRLLVSQGRRSFPGIEKVIALDAAIQISRPALVQDQEILPSSSAYVIYTSGSTGRPKGVVVNHRNVVNLFFSQAREFGIGRDERIFQFSTISFDASVEQMWLALLTGAVLVGVEKSVLQDIEQVEALLNKQVVTHLHSVPSYLKGLDFGKLPNLRRVLAGGDSCPVELARKLEGFLFYNEYGPTETTVTSMELEVNEASIDLGKLSIGRPLSNTQVYIIDESRNLQPLGVAGELCISGDGLADGYLNNPVLTAEKFIDHPFQAGQRLYRTGDLARWLPDGNIEFLGRIDHQVKVRGFRIELGEIESALLGHAHTKECVVVTREEKGDKCLCAYVVLQEGGDVEELRSYLSGLLPDYMVPGYFVALDALPLTANGKVNRRGLPAPEFRAGEDYVGPANYLEEKLVSIWSEVLHIAPEAVSVTGNFFAMGGHSLKASSCINNINETFRVNIPLIEIFKNPTIIQLANYIDVNELYVGDFDDNLVLLRRGSNNGKNIFLIHDGSGEVDGYIELCKQAEDGFNYWGIRAGNLKQIQPVNLSIEQLAEKYLDCVRNVQSQGEYLIAGWSLGGTIAFEMVRQLERDREKVAFLGIIDAIPPNTEKFLRRNNFMVKSELEWVQQFMNLGENFDYNINRDLKSFWRDIVEFLIKMDQNNNKIRKRIIEVIGFEINSFEECRIEELIKYLSFSRSLNKACKHYSPCNLIESKIQYFSAVESKHFDSSIWEDYSTGGINIRKIEGDHFSIFSIPFVNAFYKQFNESIHEKELLELS
ncbi:MAG: amino acid adenylation domain-containing protein, partial [Marinifilaceae bacterium]